MIGLLNPFSDPSDSVTDAAVRAKGIDPATDQWISAQYDTGQDPEQVAAQARADAQAYYDQQLATSRAAIDAAHQKSGGFIADLLNPFSANVDPNAWNAKLAIGLQKYWPGIVAVVVVLAVLATVHEVKSL